MNEEAPPPSVREPRRTPLSRSGLLSIVLAYAGAAAAWILFSDKLVSLLVSAPEDIVTIGTVKGWVFVLVTALGLHALLRRYARDMPAAEPADDLLEADAGHRPRLPPASIAVALVVITLAGAVGVGTVRVMDAERARAVERLQAAAARRANQIESWLRERDADAAFLSSSSVLGDETPLILAGDSAARARTSALLGQFIHYHAFQAVSLVTADGTVVLNEGSGQTGHSPPVRAALAAALRTGRPQSTALFRLAPGDPAAYFDLVVPVAMREGAPRLVAVLEIDARVHLFDILAAGRVHPDAAEMLLARRAGARLEFFGRQRGGGEGLPPGIVLAGSRFPTATALASPHRLGAALEGEGLHGGRIVAVTREIPGTDWLLVSMVERSALLRGGRSEGSWVMLSGILLAIFLVGGAYFLHQRRILNMQRALAQHQRDRLDALGLLGEIADASTDAIFAKDTAGRYLLCNTGAGLALGSTPDTVIGQDDRAFFPPADAERLRSNDLRVTTENRITTFEEVLNGPTGEVTYLATKGPLHDAAGRVVGMYGISRDITFIKRAGAALRESEETYRALFQNMLHAFAYCRIVYEDSRPIDFEYLLVNDAFTRLTGFTDVVGKRVSAVVPDILAMDPALLEMFERVASSGVSERLEYFVKAMREWLAIAAYCPRRGEFVVLFDVITERRQMEVSLHVSEDRLARAQAIARVGNWHLDSLDGTLSLSDEACRIFGLASGAPSSIAAMQALIHPDDREIAAEAEEATRKGKGFDLEFRIVVDGAVKWVRGIGEPARGEDERLMTGFGIVQDITVRKQKDEELALQNHVLELVAAGRPVAEVLATLIREVEAGRPGFFADMHLLDTEGARLVHAAGSRLPEAFTRGIGDLPVAEGAGSCGTAAARAQAVFVADIAGDPLWAGYRAIALAHSLRACWSMPILGAGGEVLGTFALYNREPGLPDEHERRMIAVATHAASICLLRDRAEQSRRETESKLRVFVENAPAAIAMLDRELRYLVVSRRWLEDYRIENGNVVGRSHYDVFPEIPAH